MSLRKRGELLVLAAGVTLMFLGATWPLNPLVTRVPEPAGPVPVGCEEGLAPAATPRMNVAEIPERELILPASMPAPPPSRSLREELDAAHRALVGNDRPAFDEHLRAARALVAAHPAGGERSRAEEVLWALNDAAVLWDAQFQSPFFDESSDAYARASRYAGYADAMRRSALTDDSDRRFFPAAESRDFVTRVAAERLQRLGVRNPASAPPRVARAETTTPRPPAVSSPPAPRSRTTTTARSATTRRRAPSTPKTRKPAALAKSASSSSPDPSKPATPAPAEPAPPAPPASAPAPSSSTAQSTAASAPPVVEDVAPTTPIVADTASTTAAVEPPVTITATPETATTTTTAAPAAAPAERRSMIVPALLILIGLGVLIVLFRVSK